MTPEDVLEWCLEAIEADRLTLPECVARFPEYPDLEQQLRLAQALTRWRRLEPPPEVARAWQARLRQAARAQARRPHAAWAATLWRRQMVRWGLTLVVTMAPLLGSAGLVNAASTSMPGDMLYSVKRVTELAQVALTPVDQQAELHVELAATRAAELTTVVTRGTADNETIGSLAGDMLSETETALAQAQTVEQAQRAALLRRVLSGLAYQQATLAAAHAQVEGDAQANLSDTLAAAQELAARTQSILNTVQVAAEVTAPTTPTPTQPDATATITASALPSKTSPATTTVGPLPGFTPTIVLALPSPSRTLTATATLRPTRTASATPTPTLTVEPTITRTVTATTTASPTATLTLTATLSPTDTPTVTVTPTASETSSPTATASPTDTPTPEATDTATSAPTDTPTATLTPTPSASPTETATDQPEDPAAQP